MFLFSGLDNISFLGRLSLTTFVKKVFFISGICLQHVFNLSSTCHKYIFNLTITLTCLIITHWGHDKHLQAGAIALVSKPKNLKSKISQILNL